MIGCNTIDPLLQVRAGEDYTMAITRRALENTKAQGFDAVEYSHALHWNEEEIARVRDMTEEIGLVPWSLHAWVGGDVMTAEGASGTQQSLRHAGKVALGLGVGRVVHHTNGSTLSGDGRERLKREAEVIRAAWQPGFRYALENMSTLAHMEYVVALVEELGPEIAGICIDSGHANLGDLGAPRALRMAGERLITTHLHDNHGTRDEHLPPGDADIAWEAVAEAIKEINYQGCLMLELTDQPSEERRAAGVVGEIARGAGKALWLAERAF
ncbi:MAG: sugar phosphate isomerase/epimerase family protein [Armatimonadia bacterium]